jgi:Tfp pilus assembly protein PilO
MNRIIKSEIVYLLKPLSFVVLIIAMFIALFRIGTSQITLLRNNLDELKAENAKLNTKYNILSSVTRNKTEDSQLYTIAVPNQSSSLFAFSQIKKIAVEKNMLISNLRSSSSSELEGNISASSISFSIDGTYEESFEFLKAISKTMPIMNITKIEFSQTADLLNTNVTLNVYSAPLPKVIPSLTSAVTALTPAENELINELSTYRAPEFVQLIPQENEVKDEPFN